MERNGQDLVELANELCGDVGQSPARLMGTVCRERFTGIQPWRAGRYVDNERMKVERAVSVMNELGWESEKPANLLSLYESIGGDEVIAIAEKHYSAYYGSSADKNGQHYGNDSQKCPFEDSDGMSRACFSCPARKEMIEELNEKAERKRGRTQE